MMPGGPPLHSVGVGVFAVLVVTALVPAAGVGVSPGPAQQVDYDEPSPMDFRVAWWANQSRNPRAPENPQAPGAKYATMQSFAEGFPVNLTPTGNITVIRPSKLGHACSYGYKSDIFGIDREPVPVDKEDLIKRYREKKNITNTLINQIETERNYTSGEYNITWYQFYREGEEPGFGIDSARRLFSDERIVAIWRECFTQPEKPGWYRWYGYINGSIDGSSEDRDYDWRTDEWWGDDPEDAAAVYSHWYYVCECENRSEAERTLGLPPQYHPDRNASVRAPNYIQNGEPQRDLNLTLYAPGDEDRLPGPDPPSTPTPTPTLTPTPTETPTPTPTPPPTSGNSPGFGSAVAAVGLVVMALLGRYRSKS